MFINQHPSRGALGRFPFNCNYQAVEYLPKWESLYCYANRTPQWCHYSLTMIYKRDQLGIVFRLKKSNIFFIFP